MRKALEKSGVFYGGLGGDMQVSEQGLLGTKRPWGGSCIHPKEVASSHPR